MPTRFFIAAALMAVAFALTGCPVSNKAPVTSSAPPKPVAGNASAAPLETVATPPGTFFTPPYLQLGASPTDFGTLAVVWHVKGHAAPGDWAVETRSPVSRSGTWKKQSLPVAMNPVNVSGVAAHTVCAAQITGLVPGLPFDYRVVRSGKPVFAARANRSRPSPKQDFRMVIFGDCAEDTSWQKKVAYQTYGLKPDAVLITGDIVYPHGSASEYRANYFPVYQYPTPDPKHGAPLLASTLFIGASGNHDLVYADLDRYRDGLAYYYYWKQPTNGFTGDISGQRPPVKGSLDALKAASGAAYPSGTSFSFDYGNAHFVVIDSNFYMNWRNPKLVDGLRKAITANPSATWRFVVFHVPPFHSSKSHQDEQWMRRLVPVFEETGVDVVWSGHVHNYQRSRPLKFVPNDTGANEIRGAFSLDTAFDGKTVTKPNGVLYVVTGAGGAALYTKQNEPTLAPFTAKYAAEAHSLTQLSVSGRTLTVRQVDENGKEIDSWKVTK